jgi:hypothetical protein
VAITINQQPSGLVSAFNHIDFLVDTDNVQPIFSYQIKPIVAGQAIAQYVKPKSIYGDKAHFDAQRTIQNQVSYDISGIVNNTAQIYKAKNVFKEFYIQFAELSGTTNTNVASGSPINSNTLIAVNTAFEYEDTFKTDYIKDYVIDSFTGKYFLTGLRGGDIRIGTTDLFELGFMQESGLTFAAKFEIKTYGFDGSLIGTYVKNNTFAGTTNTDELFLSINVGTASINNLTLTSGTQPIYTDAVDKYTIQILNTSNTPQSELLTFQIDRDCYKYTPVRIFWLNKLGRFDAYNFNFANDKSYQVTKDFYLKQGGAVVSNSFVRSSYETGDTAFNTRIESSIKLRTDYISTIESQWIAEMVKSPLAFIFNNGRLFPIKISTSSYTNKDTRKDGMFIEEIDVQFTNASYRQRF